MAEPDGYFTDKQGRVRPINGSKKGGSKGAGAVFAAGVVAVAVWASAGGGAVGGGGSASVAGESVSVRVNNAKKTAHRGNPDSVLRQMRLKPRKNWSPKRHAECVLHSFGQVREFLMRTPCRSLTRTVVPFEDEHGNTAVVSIAWARMHTGRAARELKDLDDRDGSGDFYALGNAVLASQGVSFTGEHYRGRFRGTLFVRAEVAAVSGNPDPDLLQGVADVTARLPQP